MEWPCSVPQLSQGHPLTGKRVFGERGHLERRRGKEGGRQVCAELTELRQGRQNRIQSF